MMKKATFGSKVRKRLSDITNLHSQQKSPFKENQENVGPTSGFDSSTKNVNDQLLKENGVMMKLIQEKDLIIESNRLELQKLRVNIEQTRLQNRHLAQSNSQMLAELNLSKDKLKALQHEFMCMDAKYKAQILELQEKAKLQCEANSVQEGETKPEKAAVDQPMKAVKTKIQTQDDSENKVTKTKRARTRSQSLGSTTSQQATDQAIAENKRRCLRRQSVSLKAESQDDLFEIDAANTPVTQPLGVPLSESISDDKDHLTESSKQSLPQRSSIGRPVRRAAEKVQSYKDPPCNRKMRRP